MRLSLFLWLTYIAVYVTAAGTSDNHEAQLAWYFVAYLLEEVTDTDKFTIAPSCSGGTRKGIRNQAGRCNLLEFADFVITKTQKPNLDEAKAGAKISLDTPLSELNVFDFKKILKDAAVKDLKDETKFLHYAWQVQKSQIIPEWGAQNDIEGFTREMGVKMANTVQKYKELVAADAKIENPDNRVLTSDHHKAFAKWIKNAQKGAEYIKISRGKDLDETRITGNMKNLKRPQPSLQAVLRDTFKDTTTIGDETKSVTIELEGRTSSQSIVWIGPTEQATILKNPGSKDISEKYKTALSTWNADKRAAGHLLLVKAFDDVISGLDKPNPTYCKGVIG